MEMLMLTFTIFVLAIFVGVEIINKAGGRPKRPRPPRGRRRACGPAGPCTVR